ncbi:hypothetical protein AVEN_133604-1 [Araneus ventricosus]|uniref:Reverse transcriptase Ty1/copia-type domain-containing protein n=1 Tax=Araneus ventricosus TaxID=182803 RepID=A0A4Y2N2A7_ARAVE|nr:hypothetical protein AVEN_133604-1 [Araneus ventricosus]
MDHPPGLDYSIGLVCQLKKSLYGVKQASRCWNKTFSEFLTNFGFSRSIADSCVFSGVFREKKVLLMLYVADALIFCEGRKVLLEIIDGIRKKFEATICDTGFFVGMEIDYRQDGTIFLHSENYIKRILKRFNLYVANPYTIPAEPGTILSSDSNPLP